MGRPRERLATVTARHLATLTPPAKETAMTARPMIFVDTETTHLDRDIRRAWEIAIIRRDPDGTETEHTWFVRSEDLDLDHADPKALEIGRFYERHPQYATGSVEDVDEEAVVATAIEELTRGATLAGAVTSFDEHTLDRMLRRHNLTPAWHHRLIDVRVYAAGVAGADPNWAFPEALAAFGLAEDDTTRHTALGDARLARDLYDAARQVATTRFRDTDDQVNLMADLLAGTANALKGTPDRRGHMWSDLPEVAAAVTADRDRLAAQVADAYRFAGLLIATHAQDNGVAYNYGRQLRDALDQAAA